MKKITLAVLLGALWLLPSCSGNKAQMLQRLEILEQANRADSVMHNDSLAEHLVEYFDKHGTPNERMRAHYILGRTYADLGETPKAVAAYQSAEECADTMDDECDLMTFST